jgi:hypothetical protein
MNEDLDAREARHALDIVADQRLRVSDAAVTPRWTWPVISAVAFLILWGSSTGNASTLISWAIPVLLVAYLALLRVSPGFAERLGLGVRQHKSSIPRTGRTAVTAGLACAVVLIILGARQLEERMSSADLPPWALHLLMSAVLALVVTGLVWAAGRVLRAWPRSRA